MRLTNVHRFIPKKYASKPCFPSVKYILSILVVSVSIGLHSKISVACVIEPCQSQWSKVNILTLLLHPSVLPIYIFLIAVITLIAEKIYLTKKILNESSKITVIKLCQEILVSSIIYVSTIFLMANFISLLPKDFISYLAIWGLRLSILLAIICLLYCGLNVKNRLLNLIKDTDKSICKVFLFSYFLFFFLTILTVYSIDRMYFDIHIPLAEKNTFFNSARVFNFLSKY